MRPIARAPTARRGAIGERLRKIERVEQAFQRRRLYGCPKKVGSREVRPPQLAAFFFRPVPAHFGHGVGLSLLPNRTGFMTASNPVPLHAGHLSSIQSPFDSFIVVSSQWRPFLQTGSPSLSNNGNANVWS